MSQMGGLARCGGVDARCVLSRLDSALEPLIPFKKFKESTVELRNLRFLEGAIPAKSKALVRSLEEKREGGVQSKGKLKWRAASVSVIPLVTRFSPSAHLPFGSPHSFF